MGEFKNDFEFAGAPYLESWSQENVYKRRQRNAREMSAHIVTDERWSFNEKLLKIALRKKCFCHIILHMDLSTHVPT